MVCMYTLFWKLLIIELLLEDFGNITQNTTPEENSQKMFHISSPFVLFFLWEGQRHFLRGIRIKFHLGSSEGWTKSGYGGRNPK